MAPLAPMIPLAPMTPLMAPGGSHGKPLQALSAALLPTQRSALILVGRLPAGQGCCQLWPKSPQVAFEAVEPSAPISRLGRL